MKRFSSIGFAFILLLPSCAPPPSPAYDPSAAPAAPAGADLSGVPKSAWRGATQAASAVNTARTLGSLF